ncbi:hypothetical protein [Mucilaginibacter celer]|uniref:Uncharacterized protein n=1 Tax=Mucilaginibacter celer TaxID=2305508 RepID=A0A494VJN1_9SPHI|nr:hypothetical protein [Mucilaginibacter celer]AYL95267.1 hypothetical protein HYN43_008155 [Mucilaginibacter celer]
MLKLIRFEKEKIDEIQRLVKTSTDLELINYVEGEIKVADGFNKYQAIKIELEDLMSLIDQARIGIEDYHKQLDVLLTKLNTSSLNRKQL